MDNQGQVVHLKKEILVRLVKAFFSDNFAEQARLIPFDMRPKGMEVPYRCCIYKERAILKDRAIAGLGFAIEEDDETVSLSTYARRALARESIDNKSLTVLQAACRGCLGNQIYVTDLCQGCIARPCQSACRFGAISMKNGKSVIDQSKCKKCRLCIKVCPYQAIVRRTVPCEAACPVDAIHKDVNGLASIDYEKCIRCGRCTAACPFGAVHEKSQMIDILKALKAGKKLVALIAPAVAGQFPGTLYQLRTAIIKAGFSDVVEVAQGADITSKNEAAEFSERMKAGQPFMTTSCCAGYNMLVKKHMPEIKPFVSSTKTPLYYTAEEVKKIYPNCLTVFVSPCVAKRAEGFEDDNVDFVMNCEELGAIFVALKIEIAECEETKFSIESSRQGRGFCLTGGVSGAVAAALPDDFAPKSCLVDGLNKESISKLRQFACNKCAEGNLVEVMCCEGGCISGNSVINNRNMAKKQIEKIKEASPQIEKIDPKS